VNLIPLANATSMVFMSILCTEGYTSEKNMQDTCILMGSIQTLDIKDLVASHVMCLLFLTRVLPSQANLRDLKRIVFGILKNDGIARRMDNVMYDDLN